MKKDSIIIGLFVASLLLNMYQFTNKKEEPKVAENMHMMPDGTMMMNHGNDMMDMTMTDMVKMMEGKSGKALEKEFISGMIPHHQGAVNMSRVLLQDKTISPQIKAFAESIIRAQESEIKMMNEWLN